MSISCLILQLHSSAISNNASPIKINRSEDTILSKSRSLLQIKADLKFNEEIRNEHRRKISICFSEWIRLLSQVSEEISKETEGKRPIIIFEDLDKLNPEEIQISTTHNGSYMISF